MEIAVKAPHTFVIETTPSTRHGHDERISLGGVDVTCENDWNNDHLPRRHDVTRLLESMTSQVWAA